MRWKLALLATVCAVMAPGAASAAPADRVTGCSAVARTTACPAPSASLTSALRASAARYVAAAQRRDAAMSWTARRRDRAVRRGRGGGRRLRHRHDATRPALARRADDRRAVRAGPHTGPGPATSAIVMNLGGPGVATIVNRGVAFFLFEPLLAEHDLLLVDDRGRGTNNLIDCPAAQHAVGPFAARSPSAWASSATPWTATAPAISPTTSTRCARRSASRSSTSGASRTAAPTSRRTPPASATTCGRSSSSRRTRPRLRSPTPGRATGTRRSG